jgi:pyridoxamine 5'-phosphate oxidase-like protein
VSIAVALTEIAAAAEPYGDAAFLATGGEDGRPHLSHVRVRFVDNQITLAAGRRSRANAADRPRVVVLWPPHEPDGYSLIVDADAAAAGDELVLTPTSAVLHRPA